MKTKLTFALIMIFGFLITGCKQEEKKVEVEKVKIDLVNDEFPEAKQEVMETFGAIAQSIKDGDVEADRIVAVTFTETAAAELRERIRGKLVKEKRN